MFDYDIYGITVILLLLIICYILQFWAREHATLMSIMTHTLTEIKKKLKENEPKG